LSSLKIINSDQFTEKNVSNFIPRTETELDSIRETVTEIINEVKDNGDNALVRLTKKYDNVELNTSEIRVTNQEIEKAYDLIDQDLLDALKTAKQNLIKFHGAQLKKDWFIKIAKGVRAGQIYRPLENVGIYIPGGRAYLAARRHGQLGQDDVLRSRIQLQPGTLEPGCLEDGR